MADKKIKKISTKRKFVADGVFEAELNELLMKTLSMEGYGGVEVRAANMQTEIRVFAARDKELLDKSLKKVKELQSLIEKRYGFNDQDNRVQLTIKSLPFAEALSAAANVESLKAKLLAGLPVRNAANNIMGTVMRRGRATGCEVMVSGKVRGQRAKAQKYTAGYQVSTGQPKHDFIDVAVRHVELRQGILGLKVKIMQGTTITTTDKVTKIMPDVINIREPKEEDNNIEPHVQSHIQEQTEAQQ
jgi:small subunit ribosomal protein S3e